ncbi:unnamed protein product [Lepeophtheirus salmonis]|uniref:(salmon louse) hypothetical protein n=1 Tax=Lepeophtheirus salmonis TaxID=72036 RepID=A0A7R8H379_LEPSM|nr:unnamed protein product [Lepeophtheirus salmonis]CAF2827007.1 unnamed protein product [Lepeophtheirus salmonis]
MGPSCCAKARKMSMEISELPALAEFLCDELKSVEKYVMTNQKHILKTGKDIEAKKTPVDNPSSDEEFVSGSFQACSKDMDKATENADKLSKVYPVDEIEDEMEN